MRDCCIRMCVSYFFKLFLSCIFLIGNSISISDYEGTFDETRLTKYSHLIMLAAGTGFTPMVRLLQYCLVEQKESEW